ncbi:MAG: cysteine--tRNA ligase [Clostridia bacterium]|nr:cysteine--tRNA ligase [Deltaproteobacteria bacterium]
MRLHVYNTLSGKKETFTALDPSNVKVYVCGPTVYDMAHIGHARSAVAFDVVVRYIRRSGRVTYVRNYTDIDDKIIRRAGELGQKPEDVSTRYIAEYLADMDALGCVHPDVSPKVSEHIPQIVSMVGELVAKGVAYPAEGDVYYSVASFATYGRLAKRNLDDMQAVARVEPGEQKRNPLDFALWKAAKPGEPAWETPWGPGRPGWHIECSAMSREHLGSTFDIHGGGKDLVFPHHENEIAQSEAANGTQFARYWLHNGFVNIDDEKMSKSLGNFFTVREVLKVVDPQALRWFLLSTHYRSPISFSDAALRESEARVIYVYETLLRCAASPLMAWSGAAQDEAMLSGPVRDDAVRSIEARFVEAMDDDFNTARALGDLSEVLRLMNDVLDHPADAETDARTLALARHALAVIAECLGVFGDEPSAVLGRIAARRKAEKGVDSTEIQALVDARHAARKSKDFKRADELRQELAARGIAIKDTVSGTTWNVE